MLRRHTRVLSALLAAGLLLLLQTQPVAATKHSALSPRDVMLLIHCRDLCREVGAPEFTAVARLLSGFHEDVSIAVVYVSPAVNAAPCKPLQRLLSRPVHCASVPALSLTRVRGRSLSTIIAAGFPHDQLAVGVIAVPVDGLARLRWLHQLDAKALSQWAVPQISISIISQVRIDDLQRLTAGLLATDYLGDTVDLSFSIDYSSKNASRSWAVVQHAYQLPWPHGTKRVHRRVVQGGLISAVVESYFPAHAHHYAVILEDDIAVSPLWYQYIKMTLLRYRYSYAPPSPALMGISLYTPRLLELGKRSPLSFSRLSSNNAPVLYQTPCSWGAMYFPEHWLRFHRYMSVRAGVTRITAPLEAARFDIPFATSNGWSGSWKKFLIEMMYGEGLVMMYPNFPNETSLSTNNMSPGEHIGKPSTIRHDPRDYIVPLISPQESSWLDDLVLPELESLTVLNLFAVAKRSALDLAEAALGWRGHLQPCRPGEQEAMAAGGATCLPE